MLEITHASQLGVEYQSLCLTGLYDRREELCPFLCVHHVRSVAIAGVG